MEINFVGDLMFGDQPVKFGYGFDSQHSGNNYSGVFNNVKEVFSESDYNIGNFETVIMSRPTKLSISNWSMCCDERIIPELKNAKIDILNLANNHTMDFGPKWFLYTKNQLENAGISVIGLKEKPYVLIGEEDNLTAVIGVSYLKVKDPDPLYFSTPSKENWDTIILELNKLGTKKKILYIHWGNEFIYKPTSGQIKILSDLEKYSFDAIIGHHPHIIQANFLYNKTPVFCSLGNFASDYWQNRARKSVILKFNTTSSIFYTLDCFIDEKGIPSKVNSFQEVNLKPFNGEIAETNEIFNERKRLRREYLKEIFLNGYKIKNKIKFINWIFKRVQFLVKYSRLERTNPDIIYEKYEN